MQCAGYVLHIQLCLPIALCLPTALQRHYAARNANANETEAKVTNGQVQLEISNGSAMKGTQKYKCEQLPS